MASFLGPGKPFAVSCWDPNHRPALQIPGQLLPTQSGAREGAVGVLGGGEFKESLARKALNTKPVGDLWGGGRGPEARLRPVGPRRLTEWCSYGRAGAFNERTVPPPTPSPKKKKKEKTPGEGSRNKPSALLLPDLCWAPQGGAGRGAGDGAPPGGANGKPTRAPFVSRPGSVCSHAGFLSVPERLAPPWWRPESFLQEGARCSVAKSAGS